MANRNNNNYVAQEDTTHISQTLSWLLRHGAPQFADTIQMNAAGYVPLTQILKLPQFHGLYS